MLSALLVLAGRALAAPLAAPLDLPDPPARFDDAAALAAAAALDDDATLDDAATPPDDDPSHDALADESARGALDVGASLAEDSLAATSGLVDVTSLHDLAARHHRPSRWGRLDLAIAWRRIERIDRDASEPSRRDEVWLVATWRN